MTGHTVVCSPKGETGSHPAGDTFFLISFLGRAGRQKIPKLIKFKETSLLRVSTKIAF